MNDKESEWRRIGRKSGKSLLSGILLSAVFIVDFYLLQSIFSYLQDISSNESSLGPMILLLQALTFVMFMGILCFTFVFIGKFILKSIIDVSYEGFFTDLEDFRTSLKKSASEKRLIALDEYWEIIVFSITAFFIITAIADPSNSDLSDWFQIAFSILFWASYKIAKAKQDIGLRLMSIASLIQFLFVLGSLYVMFLLFSQYFQVWSSSGVIQEEFPYTSPEWIIGLWLVALSVVGMMLSGKWVSYRVCRFTWKYLTEPKIEGVLEQEALYLSDYSVPSYLLYAFIILIGMLGSLSGLPSEYFMNLLSTCIVTLILLLFLWPFKVYLACYDLTTKEASTTASVFYGTGLMMTYYGGYVFSIGMIGLLLWISPIVAFPLASGGLPANILAAFSITSIFVLFIVHSMNGSVVHYLQREFRNLKEGEDSSKSPP